MTVLTLLLVVAAHNDMSVTVELRGAAQGTTYHIKYVLPATATAVDIERLHADVEHELAEIDREMSTYRPDSEISRFNRAPAGQWFEVSHDVAEVVSASREISEKTGGAQDITVGPLVRLWHFGPNQTPSPQPSLKGRESDKAPSPYPLPKGEGYLIPPSDAEIQAARTRVGYKRLDVRLNPPSLRKQIEGMDVDLSSIASGYTIDKLAGIIRKHGITDFMVELGGELCATGKRADGTPWRIAIERPIADKRELETSVSLVDGAMATAGGSRHFFEYGGKRYSHIIDPATGRPVEHTLASVTVAADKCLAADGWDTPLVVLGPERGSQCAEQHGIAAMFITHTEHGDEVRTTSVWRKRFEKQTHRTPGGAGG